MKNPVEIWSERKSPFRELQRMQSEFDRFFDDLIPQTGRNWSLMGGEAFLNPTCDITEDKANYYINFDMPGLTKDQVKVEMSGDLLTVSAERKEEKKVEKAHKYRSEISYGSYFRSMRLPTTIDEKKIDAQYENGVLFLTLPKSEPSHVKQIRVQ